MACQCAGVVLLLALASQVSRVEVVPDQVKKEGNEGADENKTEKQEQLIVEDGSVRGTVVATHELDLEEVTGSDSEWNNVTSTSTSSEWDSSSFLLEENHSATVPPTGCILPNGTKTTNIYLCMQLNSSSQNVFNQTYQGTVTEEQIPPKHGNVLSSLSPEENQDITDSTARTNTTLYQNITTQLNHTITNNDNATSLSDHLVRYTGNISSPSNASRPPEWHSTDGTHNSAAVSRTAAVAAATAEAVTSEVTTENPFTLGDSLLQESSTQTNSVYNTTKTTQSATSSSPVSTSMSGRQGKGTDPSGQPRDQAGQTQVHRVPTVPSTQSFPGGGWLQTDFPQVKGYPPHAIHGLIWEDRRYLLSVLVPVGCGIAGALTIVCLAYAFRNCRQEHMLPLHKHAPQTEVNPGLDRILLLADSSDDEM